MRKYPPRQNRFNAKMVTRDKKGHYITRVNIYSHIRVSIYIKQLLADLKGEIDQVTTIVGDGNTPLSTMDTLFRQKIQTQNTTLLKCTQIILQGEPYANNRNKCEKI